MKYNTLLPIIDLQRNFNVPLGQKQDLFCNVRDIVAVRAFEKGYDKHWDRYGEGDTVFAHTDDNNDGTLTALHETWEVPGCTSVGDLKYNFLQENVLLVEMTDEHGAPILVNENYVDTVRAGIEQSLQLRSRAAEPA